MCAAGRGGVASAVLRTSASPEEIGCPLLISPSISSAPDTHQ